MNEEEIRKEIDEVIDSIYKSILKNEKPKEIEIEYMMEMANNKKLSFEQRKKFDSMYEDINRLLKKSNDEKSLQVKKESFFKRLPIIRSIIKWVNNNKSKESNKNEVLEDNSELIKKDNHFKENLSTHNFKTKIDDEEIDYRNRQEEEKEEIIVISDLHSRMERWEYVKQYILKHPKTKFIIEGDATDRGLYGVELLLKIKELSEEGKVQYLPGNHDIFAYNYLKSIQNNDFNSQIYKEAKGSLELNKGIDTMNKLRNFEQVVNNALKTKLLKRNVSREELINWLGKAPIQKIIQQNGVNYALSHAVFDTELYRFDPNFNLEKAYELQKSGENMQMYNRFKNCMWYRKEKQETHYAPLSIPTNYIMVVGHTSQNEINIKDIDNSQYSPIIYVDSGKAGELKGYNLTTSQSVDIETKINHER